MRYILMTAAALCSIYLTACNNTQPEKAKEFPKPGTVVATAQMPVQDELNKFDFTVKVIADSDVKSGVYDVDADFGPNFAEGKFTMPKGGEYLKPAIRKGSDQYTYIIGFKMDNDTTFYDYFEVRSSKESTRMQYLKAYSF